MSTHSRDDDDPNAPNVGPAAQAQVLTKPWLRLEELRWKKMSRKMQSSVMLLAFALMGACAAITLRLLEKDNQAEH